MTPNAMIAEATLAHLVGLGVKDFVLCAGARNIPLVGSLLQIQEENDLQVWNHFDERTASFFGLGLARRSLQPVAILTTSGTAVAELLPATIEAFYSGVPLILVSADRPVSFRGSGAPQAIEQADIFGSYTSAQIDVTAATDLSGLFFWDRKSPLHLNVCFEEPSCDDTISQLIPVEMPGHDLLDEEKNGVRLEAFLANPTGLLVLLGALPDSWRGPVEELLFQLKVPYWAEATSGLRESSRLASLQIANECQLRSYTPKKVLRIGGVPSLRFWRDLETHIEIEVMSVSSQLFSGLARGSLHLASYSFPVPPELPHVGLAQEGQADDSSLLDTGSSLSELLFQFSGSEPSTIRELSEQIPEEALVFLGNSLPIREWNLAASFDRPHPKAVASRGANGIDGQIATFLGTSRNEEESWGIFGDLTTMYDLNAPALLEQLPSGSRRIVIVNNGGGRIFSRLPSMSSMTSDEKAVTENRHGFRFESWAAMWGMNYFSWNAGDPFPQLSGESAVLEIFPSEEATEAFWEAWK